MKATDFYTVPKSEAGVKVPLLKPDGGDSKEWLRIIGPDSKRFGEAVSDLNRSLADLNPPRKDGEPIPVLSAEDMGLREALAKEIMLDYVEQLVIGWSFEDDFTPDALREFLKNSPTIATLIPNVSTDRSRFFGLDSPASTPGPTSVDDLQAPAPEVSPIATLKGRKAG
jgi:hypothetical protein